MSFDEFLDNAEDKRNSAEGRLFFDGAGFVPGVNVLSEGTDAELHSLLAMRALRDGNIGDALEHEGEAALHGGMAALNFVTMGEAGSTLKTAHKAAEWIHRGETLYDGFELGREKLGYGHSIADGATSHFMGGASLGDAAHQHFDYSKVNAVPAK